jgi:hypothetical protein
MNKSEDWTNSEQYRRQCEARAVLRMTKEQRRRHYEGVLLHRKQGGLDYLKEEVKRQWEKKREVEMER